MDISSDDGTTVAFDRSDIMNRNAGPPTVRKSGTTQASLTLFHPDTEV